MNVWGRFRGYIGALSPPDSWKDFVDVFTKTVVAAVSALIAIVLFFYDGYQKTIADQEADIAALESGRERAIKEAVEAERRRNADDRDTIALFLQYMPKDEDRDFRVKVEVLSTYCDGSAKQGVDKALCSQLRQLGADYDARTRADVDRALASAAQSGDAAGYANSEAAQSHGVALAAQESSGSVADTGQWFCVVASIPRDRERSVKQVADALRRSLQPVGISEVRTYLTRISNSYAITAGGLTSERNAKACAARIQRSGVVRDAFAQANRDWREAKF